VNIRYPDDAALPAARLRHVARLREGLRRHNNACAAGADAPRWHREWFLPRSRAVLAAELALREPVHGIWRPAGPDDEPPWLAERRRVRALPAAAPELEALSLDEAFDGPAVAAELPDPIEDFSAYTEDDPGGEIAVAPAAITFTGWEPDNQGQVSRVYADKGAGALGTAFTHDVECLCTARSAGLSYVPWSVANHLTHAWDAYASFLPTLVLRAYQHTTEPSGLWYLYQATSGGRSFDTSVTWPALGTRYYLTLERAAGSLTARIYTDAARTVLDDALVVACSAADTYRYLYAARRWAYATTTRTLDGSVANLDLHGAPAGLAVPVAAHHYRQQRGDA